MATIPVPRSWSEITGDMLDALLSKLGLPSVRVGSGVLSIIEAAAQSDLRSSQDIFNLLNSSSLDRATGLALDRIGADEDAPRFGQLPSSGPVTISDSSFAKISSRIFQGRPAPIIGADKIYVADALAFPASGSVYIGRGTTNYEGPLAYTSKVNNTNYWTLNLAVSSYTTKYHNFNEIVVLAQGGDRLISAGTLVQTPQANTSSAVQFSVQYAASIPDGETSVGNVNVIAKTPGVVGNIIAGSINAFVSPPFTGATVTNPLPYSNGLGTEDDNTYRERIRAKRQSRSRATPLAIKTGITGISSLSENKRVISCSILRRQDYPTTVYLDDGSGYEEASIGIPLETLVDQALGGEQYFQLIHGRPVSKACVTTGFQAPFTLEANMRIAIKIGGKLSEHVFAAAQFRSITNASAYEVVASVNSDVDLSFSARTSDAGTRVVFFSKSDTEEDIEVVLPSTGVDANTALGFSGGKVDTLRLYKNDILLTKDGQLAILTGNPQSNWTPVVSGVTLEIVVDGINIATTPPNTYIITDADFVNAGTGYSAVSVSNSMASWARVLEYKIPGITAAASGSAITLTSNQGRTSRASVAILGGSLQAAGFFPIATATGKDLDYTLDRNLGQIRLEDSMLLHSGDRLSAGSYATRAFLQSAEITTLSLAGAANTTVSGEAGAELWFVVDGAAEIIGTTIGPTTTVTFNLFSTHSWGQRARIASAGNVFANAQIGDWIIVSDTAVSYNNRGAWRIASVNSLGASVDIERNAAWVGTLETAILVQGGIYLVRTAADLQRVYIPNGVNYTAASLSASIASQLRGGTAATYRTRQFRVRTNTFGAEGDIALAASNAEGLKLTLAVASATANKTSHLASIEAGNPETGTPQFEVSSILSAGTSSAFTLGGLGLVDPGSILVGLRPIYDSGTRYSNGGHVTPIESITGTSPTVRRPAVKVWLPADRLYAATPYAMTSADEMTVVVDGDTSSSRFVIPMFRRVTPGSAVYGTSNDFKDADNGALSLAKAFGTTMDWRDFAVFMRARGKSHGSPDTNKTLMWRYKRQGSEGNRARVQYVYPTAPSQSILASWTPLNSTYTDIAVRLPSGAARTGVTLSNNTRLGNATTATAAGLYTRQIIYNLSIASATREVRLDFNSSDLTWAVTNTIYGVTSGATATIAAGSQVGAASGHLVLTGVIGVFLPGENLKVPNAGGTVRAVATGSQYGFTWATLALPTGITACGFVNGAVLHIEYNGTGTGAGFLTGNRTIVDTDYVSLIGFVEGTTAIGATASVGTVSYDTIEVKTTGSTVVVGDIQNISSATYLPAAFTGPMKIQSISAGLVVGETTAVAPISGTIAWNQINSTANLSWYPLGTSTIVAIAAAVNAQTDCPVSVFLAGDGLGDTSGSITYATYEAVPNGLGASSDDTPWYYLADGLNWVRSHSTPVSDAVDFNFTFKAPITAGLSTNSDWANEEVCLVPITAENISEYLSTSGPGGLFSSGESVVSNQGGRPQITTLTAGSGGSVQVQGGTANSISCAVRGQAQQALTTSVVTVATSDTNGLSAGHWMVLQNVNALPKDRITSMTDLDSIGTNGVVIFDGGGTKAWEFATTSLATTYYLTWQIERQGRFVCYQYVSGGAPNLTGAQEGDWVFITADSLGTVNLRNTGWYRIVRIDNTTKTFWVENDNALEETATARMSFLTYDSIIPGDELSINTDLWGTGNLGTWVVESVDLVSTGGADNKWKFTLRTLDRTPEAVITPGPGALGTNSSLIRVVEKAPSRLIKKISTISPNPLDSTLSDIKFDSWAGGTKVSEAAGTVLSSLDKLAFSTVLAAGIDGYRHSTGLIEEANKVGYGVDSDPSAYPGLIAAGANVNIEGPLIHRIQVALALRIRSGVNARDIKTAVRSAVAASVNRAGVGKQIALSDLVSVAQAVNGVVAVTVISPSYGPGSDVISVQPYEKPMILNLDDDILISFVGE